MAVHARGAAQNGLDLTCGVKALVPFVPETLFASLRHCHVTAATLGANRAAQKSLRLQMAKHAFDAAGLPTRFLLEGVQGPQASACDCRHEKYLHRADFASLHIRHTCCNSFTTSPISQCVQ